MTNLENVSFSLHFAHYVSFSLHFAHYCSCFPHTPIIKYINILVNFHPHCCADVVLFRFNILFFSMLERDMEAHGYNASEWTKADAILAKQAKEGKGFYINNH